MELMKTLGWIIRGTPAGFVLTVTLFTALYILVPMETPHSNSVAATPASEVAR